ncbi:glycoside hydrolase family 3 C-terminal domain-containing protein [Streptomyces turgidiscabies]|uniref:Exo-alpha-(1->6)-L-arabinopyranosidase n=1 Tax=Streptomyces turgidiscabies (strain Car8) TaxID=698760 RepID=L7FIY5_STRT8|nr:MULTISPECIES: glycoside hydrolase family 3 C-terminal domain-containing protein [Streptomyces]ELP71119.1 glycosyl hydrolase family 3 C-terminal domain protein [Streptomyces turgidiscabies Car8]MDX3496954.1 glycoside hydrolase family 3 C-terminal domain-containing protein [Streptomyces turgidiscabies]GAQ76274.1 xylan 1,4-beta-xylosidase precursor [Streptomyces turgidiscabies]
MTAQTPPSPPFRDPRLPTAKRIDDLLSRLTLDERVAFLHQFAPAVERLGVAAFRTGQEALHGVAWMGPATVFPQAVGLGATWNEELVQRVGEVVSREVRAMRARDDRVGLNVWAPTVNLLRHPLWGRNEEGYSEDPKLTSAIATAYTRGLRGDHPAYWRTAPVLKHWLAHNNETGRDVTSSSVRPRVLHEYDLRAFRETVEAGAVAGVMPAYNLVNGRPNHVSPLLGEHLRTWTDEDLLVCSDAAAPSNLVDSEHYFDTHEEATAAALVAGVDSFTDHGTDSSKIVARLQGALSQGLLTEEDIDRAVRRQLSVRFRLGEFDPQYDPYASVPDFDTPAHRALALEAAEQAIVLLKNDAGTLPLSPGSRVAVVGLLADECKADWYSGTLIHRSTPLEALYERFGAEHVEFAEGVDRVRLRTSAGTFLHVPPAEDAPDVARGAEGALDPALLAGRTDLPALTVDADGTEFALIDWGEGLLTLRAPDGRYLSVAEDGYVRASADQPGGWVVQETFRLEPHGSGEAGEADGSGGSGDSHKNRHLLRHVGTGRHVSVAADGVKVADGNEAPPEIFELIVAERGEESVKRVAARADVVVVVAGNDPHINGRETEDRTTLRLPAHQQRLLDAARAANPRTVLALTSAYPYAVDVTELPAALWTAHGGQAAGTALARVLAGDVSPAGRLPQTWYADDADLPDLLDYDIIGSRQTYLYFEGAPLFPFGHGLSYASFAYTDLTAEAADDGTLRVSFTVTNTGDVTADEVAQLYTRAPESPVARPRRELLAHRRITLAPGASAFVSFELPLSCLEFWDVAIGGRRLAPGAYEVLVGASSEDIRVLTTVQVTGTPSAPRPVRQLGLSAADFDEQTGVEIVDRTKVSGDAVTPAGGKEAELLYRDCDFGAGLAAITVEVAGEGVVEVVLDDDTEAAAVLTPTPTEGPYDYTTVRATLTVDKDGVHDLRLRLRGPLRLAHVGFSG